MGIDIGLTARETGFYEDQLLLRLVQPLLSSALPPRCPMPPTSFIIEYIMGQKTRADWESFKQS